MLMRKIAWDLSGLEPGSVNIGQGANESSNGLGVLSMHTGTGVDRGRK
jgi:hypothetical protein